MSENTFPYPDQRCENCRFWNFEQETNNDFDPKRCWRHPPSWRGSSLDAKVWFCDFSQSFNDSWCGWWQPRKEERDRKKALKARTARSRAKARRV